MTLKPNEKRLVLILAGVVGVVFAYLSIIAPLFERLGAANTRIEQNQLTIDNNNLLISSELRERNIVKPLATKMARDASTAESQLTNRVLEAARTSGLGVQSLKPERSEMEQGYMRSTVRMSATGRLGQVSRFLYELQRFEMPVRVSEVNLTSRKEGQDDLSIQVAISTIYDAAQQKVTLLDARGGVR